MKMVDKEPAPGLADYLERLTGAAEHIARSIAPSTLLDMISGSERRLEAMAEVIAEEQPSRTIDGIRGDLLDLLLATARANRPGGVEVVIAEELVRQYEQQRRQRLRTVCGE